MAKTKPGKIHAILGRSRRTGRWRLGPKTSVVAMLGTCRLDLRHAHIDNDTSKMSATVFLGGVTIIIPPGVEVRPSGMSLLGGASVNVPVIDDFGDPVLIELEWTSIFGRLRVGDEAEFEHEQEKDEEKEQVDEAAGPELTAEPAPPALAAPAPVGFEDLEPTPEPPAPIGFEDLDEPTPEPPGPIGFEDLDEPTPEPPGPIGFEDLDEPTPEPPTPVGFEDLDEPTPEPTPEPPAPVGFEDLDEPTPAEDREPETAGAESEPEPV